MQAGVLLSLASAEMMLTTDIVQLPASHWRFVVPDPGGGIHGEVCSEQMR